MIPEKHFENVFAKFLAIEDITEKATVKTGCNCLIVPAMSPILVATNFAITGNTALKHSPSFRTTGITAFTAFDTTPFII